MARERHHSSHPLPERSAPVLSLPGVAELLSSRPSPTDSISPRQHHQHHHHQEPPRFAQPSNSALRSTPPPAPSLVSSANGVPAADPCSTPALLHASQPSPTDTTTSTSPLEQHQYYQSYAPQLKSHFNSSLPSPAADHQQDASHSHLYQSHTHRQDSAVSQQLQQRLDITRAPHSSDLPTYHSHRSPNDNRQSSSPRVSNSSHSPSSVHHPTGSTAYPQPLNQATATYSSQRGHAASPPATHPNLEGPRTHDAANPTAPASSYLDPPHHTNTRQARYNVRFAANQTPDNMPSVPKPRQDVVQTPSSPESDERPSVPREQRTPPVIEPALQLLRPTEEQAPEPPRNTDTSVERCSGCGATWSRPLPERFEDPKSDVSMAMALEEHSKKLENHGKKADALYQNWKWEHSHCPQSNGLGHRKRSSSPYHSDGAARQRNGNDSTGNKRKADPSHHDDDETTSKQRRFTRESTSNTTRPVQPAASK